MKRFLLLAATAGFCFLSTSYVEARTLLGASDWSVNRVESATPYCTLARQYEAGAVVTFARNAKGEGTIAFDFQRDAFDLTRPYPITLSAGNVLRQYVIKPVNMGTIIMRTSTDSSLFEAMEVSPKLSVKIDREKFDVELSGYQDAFKELNSCIGYVSLANVNTGEVVMPSEQKAPRPPVIHNNLNETDEIIQNLLEDNRRLTELLSSDRIETTETQSSSDSDLEIRQELLVTKKKNIELMQRVSQLELQLAETVDSVDPNIEQVLKEKNTQIAMLTRQNDDLKRALDESLMTEPKVIVKEVIKEVPSSNDDSEANIRVAEAETEALTFKAERDEYRRLLQNERARLKDMIAMKNQITGLEGESGRLVDDIRRIEAEKADLIRELEFVKSSARPSSKSENTMLVQELTTELSSMRENLRSMRLERDSLKSKVDRYAKESRVMKEKIASMDKDNMASESKKTTDDLELLDLQQEITSLRLDNDRLKQNIISDNKIEKRLMAVEKENIRLTEALFATKTNLSARQNQIAKSDNVQPKTSVKEPVSVIPTQGTNIKHSASNDQADKRMVALSGDYIRRLVSQSKIPLKNQINRVERISGPDFAAFRWDTGAVYGSAEQSRLSSVNAFDKSVRQYINKTQNRCRGTFDKTVADVSQDNELVVKSADIACIDEQTSGHAASILFFMHNDMFYALAHEADLNGFDIAMNMRDQLVSSISDVF